MPESTEAASEYITPAVAERIAFLSAKQISRIADAGRIAFIRPGKHRRYLRADVEALIHKPAPVPEVMPPATSVAGSFPASAPGSGSGAEDSSAA